MRKIRIACMFAGVAAAAFAAETAAQPPAENVDSRPDAPVVELEDSFLDRYIDLSTELAFYSAYV